MKIVQLQGIRMPDLPENTPEYLSRPVPPECFPLHLLSACIGGRGAGKSSFALKLVKLYDKAKSFDRIILFSTTAHKEPKMKNFLNSKTFAELSHYKGFNEGDLRNEMDRMESDIEAYRAYKSQARIWDKYVSSHYNVDAMTYEEIISLDLMGFAKPLCPNKSGMYPCHLIMFDDLVGCRVFRANMNGLANNLLISHRHYSASVLILSQSFTSFIPKPVRGSNIGLWVLFACKCEKTMKEISEDVASKISPEQFVKAWKCATEKPYNAFVCDYDTSDSNRRFRINLDKLLIMDSEDEKQN